jgi:cobalt/nickel transport system permease protein
VHHVVLERWSTRSSALHRADPRAKVVVLLTFLVVLATAHRDVLYLAPALACLLVAAVLWARLPLAGALSRAAVVLPFSLAFAAVCWITGDPVRGIYLAVKSYLSALAVLLLMSTTPLPALLRGLEAAGAPRFLLMVAQFVYRYLFVISEEAQHMAKAAWSRGASASGLMANSAKFRAAAGALAVLFARSFNRAAEIHRAMLGRGFEGHFESMAALRFGISDVTLAVSGCMAPIAIRVLIERFA